MATLTVQNITRAGLEATYAAAAGGGDKFLPDRETLLHVKNGGGGDITVTVTTQQTDAIGNAVADNAVIVTAAEERFIGPFPAEHYAAAADGLAVIAYTGVTTVTIAAFKLNQP